MPTRKLANGDLDGMDAGELREHVTRYVADLYGFFDAYATAIVSRIAALTGADPGDVTFDIDADAAGLMT